MGCCQGTIYRTIDDNDDDILLKAVIGALDNAADRVFSDNSIGDWVRLQISRNGVVIETTEAVAHTGGNMPLTYTAVLQNGDVICVQLANEQDFSGNWVEDCRTVPTPRFTFVTPTPVPPAQVVRWDEKPLTAPNCLPADVVTVHITLIDRDGNTAEVSATGRLIAFNDGTDENTRLELDGETALGTINTPFGMIDFSANYPAEFDIYHNETVEMHVTDCVGWKSITPHTGITNLIVTDEGEPIVTKNTEGIIYTT